MCQSIFPTGVHIDLTIVIRQVWVIPESNEVFTTYEPYLDRMDFYKQRHFVCEITGHSGLTFFEALKSEVRIFICFHRELRKQLILYRWTRLGSLIVCFRSRSRDPFCAGCSSRLHLESIISVG